jgi:CDP-glucose 4,6-dehydratase
VEDLVMTSEASTTMFSGVFSGSRVLVTGHTGFKGSWLCEWLLLLGARVTGYGLQPEASPALFSQLGLASRLEHVIGDIRSADAVRQVVLDTRPDFIFHLAAQPLVRRSYREGSYTWETNVLGTVYLLEALRLLDKACVAVMVTSDKCYHNNEWTFGYRETDPLGGHDPYSSSKAGAELAIASWRRSFFPTGHAVQIASVRAGNVIGGGDWAQDRIVPDAIRSLSRSETIDVRHPSATRPWQHVLEPNSGYLALAAAMATRPGDPMLTTAFNIGPSTDANQSVRHLVEAVLECWPGSWRAIESAGAPHEASLLQLDTSKIQAAVGWRPTWTFAEAVRRTIKWYRDVLEGSGHNVVNRTHTDIRAYEADASKQRVVWTSPIARQFTG